MSALYTPNKKPPSQNVKAVGEMGTKSWKINEVKRMEVEEEMVERIGAGRAAESTC